MDENLLRELIKRSGAEPQLVADLLGVSITALNEKMSRKRAKGSEVLKACRALDVAAEARIRDAETIMEDPAFHEDLAALVVITSDYLVKLGQLMQGIAKEA